MVNKMDLNIKIPEGFDLIGNYNNQYVIAKNQSPSAPEPYVVWAVDYDKKGVHSGTYFASLQMAQLSFCERAFDAEQLYAAHAKLDRMQELTHQAVEERRCGRHRYQSAVEAAEHLYYAVTADDIKAAIKAVYNLESQRSNRP